MDDYEYIKKMDRIGFTFMAGVFFIAVTGYVLYSFGYETISSILMASMILLSIIGAAYATRSNKKQFAKGEKDE